MFVEKKYMSPWNGFQPSREATSHFHFCLLSSFLLFETRYVRDLIAFWCMFSMRVLIFDFGMFRLVGFLMERSCTAPLAPAVMVMRGLFLHPLFCTVLISGSYLVCFSSRAWSRNLS